MPLSIRAHFFGNTKSTTLPTYSNLGDLCQLKGGSIQPQKLILIVCEISSIQTTPAPEDDEEKKKEKDADPEVSQIIQF